MNLTHGIGALRNMEVIPRVVRRSLLDGARQAEGLAVIIDVYRAFTSAAFMLYLGAERIALCAEASDVLELKAGAGYLAVGEIGGRMVRGFDLGNSPTQILQAGRSLFDGRRVAQRTSAGTAGAVAAADNADEVILGSYVTAKAAARYIQGIDPAPRTVSLVAMGNAGLEASAEDEACADYLESLLSDRPYDHLFALRDVVASESTQKFLKGDQDHYPPSDPIYCLQRDLFEFAVVASREKEVLVARRAEVPEG